MRDDETGKARDATQDVTKEPPPETDQGTLHDTDQGTIQDPLTDTVQDESPVAKLTPISTNSSQQAFVMRLGENIVLGRSKRADFKIKDSRLTRLHCELRLEPQGIVVSDLGSTNGTWVRGQRVEGDARLDVANGGMIRIADTDVEVAWTMM